MHLYNNNNKYNPSGPQSNDELNDAHLQFASQIDIMKSRKIYFNSNRNNDSN